jgi:hypothetical protein
MMSSPDSSGRMAFDLLPGGERGITHVMGTKQDAGEERSRRPA